MQDGRGLLADHLDADLPLPWAVELGEDDRLEPSERQLAVVDTDGDVAAEQRRPKVRVRVAALAVGDSRIVVTIAVALGHELLHQRAEVVDQRALELVDEQRTRRVQRVDQRDTGRDGELLNRVAHELGDVRDLGPLGRRQRERRRVNLHRRALSGARHLDYRRYSQPGRAKINRYDTDIFPEKSIFLGPAARKCPTSWPDFDRVRRRSASRRLRVEQITQP